jgi:hypothetical protein
VPTIAAHPLPALLDAGVNVTVNSDDPAYFGGYVADNYLAIAAGLGLGLSDLAALAANSVAACLSERASLSFSHPRHDDHTCNNTEHKCQPESREIDVAAPGR